MKTDKLQDKATRRPWKLGCQFGYGHPYVEILDNEGDFVAGVSADNPNWKSNAALIVRAVNAHDALKSALKNLMDRVAKDAENYAPEGNEAIWAFIEDASDALALAEGK